MEGLQVHVVEDVHEGVGIGNEANPTSGLDSILDIGNEDREIWLEGEQEDLLEVNDAWIFYSEFPPLPDFRCMSSSSSSSSTPAPVKTIYSSSVSSSSSSGASRAAMKSDADEDGERSQNDLNYHSHHHRNYDQYDPVDVSTATLSSTASMEIPRPPPDRLIDPDDCMDMVEAFSYTELLENNDFFDPSSIFQSDDEKLLEDIQQKSSQQEQQQQPLLPQQGDEGWTVPPTKDKEESQQGEGGGKGAASDDIATVFLEWLKSNKETVSAEDFRKVKIRKSTIECAARRLGGGKQAMIQLLKLILDWVQTNHLLKRGLRASSSNLPCQFRDFHQNPSPNPILNPNLNCCSSIPLDQSNPCFTQSPWIPPPAENFVADLGTVVSGFPPMVGYIGDLFTNGASNVKGHRYAPQADYRILESASSWPGSQFALASRYTSFVDNNLHNTAPLHPSPTFSGYGNQYLYQYGSGQGESLARPGPSATKEARKKRMARQRRLLSHHRNQSHYNNQQQQTQVADQHASLGIRNENGSPPAEANPGNWVYWPTTTSAPAPALPPVSPVDAQPPPSADRPAIHLQAQNYQLQLCSERRQGWKPEKNMMFILQKVLKQSDVGNLGRIVLPKKEAETHLPELEARDGISIAMEDIGTSRVWNMRYRFWPNNKSRMYLLENTGDFVRTNGLQKGDFIVIYSDVKCGKYLIRGVKVRQPPGTKAENKRLGKSLRNGQASSPSSANGSSSKPFPQIQARPQTQNKGERSNPPIQ